MFARTLTALAVAGIVVAIIVYVYLHSIGAV